MKKFLILLPLLAAFQTSYAVEKLVGTTVSFNTTDPVWPTSGGLSAWAYVGQVDNPPFAASGTYLRNGWVLTAAHVGPQVFYLGGNTYNYDGTTQTFGTADLRVFHLTTSPNLPDLAISAIPPTPLSAVNPGSQVGMIGYGGGQGETWGLNTVTAINQIVNSTTAFSTRYGNVSAGPNSANNQYVLIDGDSGGGDFVQQTAGVYSLVGINLGYDKLTTSQTYLTSYFADLSTYKTQIDAVTATPEPSTWTMLGLGGLMGAVVLYRRRRIAE